MSEASDSELGLMFLTSLVPLLVPSVFHSSTPCLPSFAEKNIVSPTTYSFSTSALRVRASPLSLGLELPLTVLMSLTSVVPFSVPSLFHSSTPCLPSSAAKNTCLPITVTVSGWLQPLGMPHSLWSQRAPGGESGLMSLTSLVPLSVPSLFHSSSPYLTVLAEKKITFLLRNTLSGSDEPVSVSSTAFITRGPGSMSLMSLVPGFVPLLFHSSSPNFG